MRFCGDCVGALLLRVTVLAVATIGVGLSGECDGSILFEETFEDQTANGITTNFGQFSIASGLRGTNFGYSSEDQIGGGQIFCLDGIQSDNVRIDADFTINTGWCGDFEIGFNISTVTHQDYRSPDGYWVTIHPRYSDSTDGILKMIVNPVDGLNDGIGIATSPWVIGANEVHTLSVERLGDSINSFVDGNPFMSAVDGTYHGGEIYFRFFGAGTVDNIRVTNLAAVPEPASLAVWSVFGVIGIGVAYRRRRLLCK